MTCFRILLLLVLALAAVAPPCHAGGKSPGLYIGFHPEGEESEGPRLVRPDTVGGKKRWFRISPELSTRHFRAYTPFLSEDGATWGAALQLTEEGERAARGLAANFSGRLVRIVVNGRSVDTVLIDRHPEDGYMIIWRGLTAKDFELMNRKLRRIGGEAPSKP